MKVLASLIIFTVAVIAVVAGIKFFRDVLRRRADARTLLSLTLSELLNHSVVEVKSLMWEMDKLKQNFSPSAYNTRKQVFSDFGHMQMCLRRMKQNIFTFYQLGWLSSAYTLGEDELARVIVTKAVGCKVELNEFKWRIRIYELLPASMWWLLGKKLAISCLNLGNDLIEQYESLTERVLNFAYERGEPYQYESLLSAL